MPSLNIDNFYESFSNLHLYFFFAIVAVAGALGGIAHKLSAAPDDKTPWYSYVILGAIAALGVYYILSPVETIKIVALSLVAGYAGKAVLDALQAKALAAITQQKLQAAVDVGEKTTDVGRQAVAGYRACLESMHPELVEPQTRLEPFSRFTPQELDEELNKLSAKLQALK